MKNSLMFSLLFLLTSLPVLGSENDEALFRQQRAQVREILQAVLPPAVQGPKYIRPVHYGQTAKGEICSVATEGNSITLMDHPNLGTLQVTRGDVSFDWQEGEPLTTILGVTTQMVFKRDGNNLKFSLIVDQATQKGARLSLIVQKLSKGTLIAIGDKTSKLPEYYKCIF